MASLVVLIVLAVIGVLQAVMRARRARHRILVWAEGQGLNVTSLTYQWFSTRRFFWTAGRSRFVYEIRAADRTGRPRAGLVRAGAFFQGVQAQWDDD